jgi:hypothetical protein
MSIHHIDPRSQLSDIEARLAQFERWVSAGSVLSFVLALSSYGILEALWSRCSQAVRDEVWATGTWGSSLLEESLNDKGDGRLSAFTVSTAEALLDAITAHGGFRIPIWSTCSAAFPRSIWSSTRKEPEGGGLKLFPSVVALKVKEWKGSTPSTYDTETGVGV